MFSQFFSCPGNVSRARATYPTWCLVYDCKLEFLHLGKFTCWIIAIFHLLLHNTIYKGLVFSYIPFYLVFRICNATCWRVRPFLLIELVSLISHNQLFSIRVRTNIIRNTDKCERQTANTYDGRRMVDLVLGSRAELCAIQKNRRFNKLLDGFSSTKIFWKWNRMCSIRFECFYMFFICSIEQNKKN